MNIHAPQFRIFCILTNAVTGSARGTCRVPGSFQKGSKGVKACWNNHARPRNVSAWGASTFLLPLHWETNLGLLFFIPPAKKPHENLLITFLDCCFVRVVKDASKKNLRNIVKAEAKHTEIQVHCSPQDTRMTSSKPPALLFSTQHPYCPSHLVTEMSISNSILLHWYCRRNSEMSDQQICLGIQLFQSCVREPQGFLSHLAVKPQPSVINFLDENKRQLGF